jgi:hypothetical protein
MSARGAHGLPDSGARHHELCSDDAVSNNQGLLQVSPEQRDELEIWAQSRSLPAGNVFRARLILSLAGGRTYSEIEQTLGESAPTVSTCDGC